MRQTISMAWRWLGIVAGIALGSFAFATAPHFVKHGWDAVVSIVAFVFLSLIAFMAYRWHRVRSTVGVSFEVNDQRECVRLLAGPLWACALWFVLTIVGAVAIAFLQSP